MKNVKIVLVLITLLISSQTSYGQFIKKLGERSEDAAKEAVIRKTAQKVNRETEKTMDTILDGKKGGKKKNKKSSKNDNGEPDGIYEEDEITISDTSENEFGIYSNFTFIPGNKLLFYDDFTADALGDFPANWETGGSGEVVTISESNTKWLSVVRRSGYLPTMENILPENYTIEFDLVNNGYGAGKPSSKLFFTLLSKKSYAGGSGGILSVVEILLSSGGFNVSQVSNWGAEMRVGSTIDRSFMEYLNSTIHISIAVNKKRLRMWVNEEKVIDSPNLIQDKTGKYFLIEALDIIPESGHFVGVSNFRIAEATEDLRSLLLKNGKFSTTGIYFDTAAYTVKKESYGVISEIAKILKENPEINLQIIGHTDNQGDESYNQFLSQMRAQTVKTILYEEFEIDDDRLEFIGKGATEPVDNNTSEKGRANNRRVEFIKI